MVTITKLGFNALSQLAKELGAELKYHEKEEIPFDNIYQNNTSDKHIKTYYGFLWDWKSGLTILNQFTTMGIGRNIYEGLLDKKEAQQDWLNKTLNTSLEKLNRGLTTDQTSHFAFLHHFKEPDYSKEPTTISERKVLHVYKFNLTDFKKWMIQENLG